RDHALDIPETAAVVACDIASGLVADTGDIPGNVLRADLTVTFGAAKLGLLVGTGGQHCGEVTTVDIGLGAELQAVQDPWWVADQADIRSAYGAPQWDAHKYSRGVLSVVAGSPQYPGAAVLVVNAVAATGVGYMRLVAERPRDNSVAEQVLAAHPQVVLEAQIAAKATAVGIGPAAGDAADDRERVNEAPRGGPATMVRLSRCWQHTPRWGWKLRSQRRPQPSSSAPASATPPRTENDSPRRCGQHNVNSCRCSWTHRGWIYWTSRTWAKTMP